jgi:hypothetical protein
MGIVGRLAQKLGGEGASYRGRLIAALIVVAGGLVALTTLNLHPPFDLLGRFGGLPFRVGGGQEPPATANFLRGQQTFDAHLIWESYSDRVVQALEDRGATVDDTQRQLDRLRQSGSPIQHVEYVGGHPLPTGSMEFYVVTRSGPCSTGGGSQVLAPRSGPRLIADQQQTCQGAPVYVPYVFTLDDKGKIDRVE